MSTFNLTIRVIHVLGACFWVGAGFFAAWFLLPGIRDAGPEGGKVMLAVQKRGWLVAMPVIATTTVLTGFWLYRPYMGVEGNAAKYLGFGGILGVICLVLGATVVSRGMDKATKLAAEAATLTDAGARGAALNAAAALRARSLTWVRFVSVLLIVTAMLMAMAMYV